MSDLPQDNQKSNPYYRNRRIRRFLIRYGLINRQGDIIPSRPRAKETVDQNGDGEPKRTNRSNFRSPGRAKSAHLSARELRSRSRRPSAKPKSPEKTRCRVVMNYIGRQTNIDYDKSWFQHEGDEIVVMQQHCGGENLTVYKGFVKPQESFAFDSQRHPDYPFALALYINGLIDCRVSVCCEYKHRKNVPLGGPSGSFSIADVQKVKPCRSCRFERLKKKSKAPISLGIESGRYRRSVVPRIPSRRSTPSPSKESPGPGERAGSTQPSDDDDKRPGARVKSPIISQTSTRTSLPQVSRKSSSSSSPRPEVDDKKPSASPTKHDQTVAQKTYNTRAPSPSASSTSDDEDKKPTKPSAKPTKTTFATQRSTEDEDSDSTHTLENDDKRPQITSAKPRPQTAKVDRQKTPEVSRTPLLDEDDKRPQAKPFAPTISKGFQKPVTSQTNEDDTENYEPDFDESNDDDDRPSNTRYGRPRISDANLSDTGYKIQQKPPESTDDETNGKPSTILNGKEKIQYYSKDDSFNKPDKSGQSPVNVATNGFNTKSSYDRSSPQAEGTRRLSSSSSEDFFGIKRTSPRQQNKTTPGLSSDWFEEPSRNNVDENNSTPKGKDWEKLLFENEN